MQRRIIGGFIGFFTVLGVLGSSAVEVRASMITFTSSSGNLSASATFQTSGSDLLVTLTNTSAEDVLIPSEVLTGVFFKVSGPLLALVPVSAIVPAGSSVFYGGTDSGGGVGGEWAYHAGLMGPGGTGYGISSAGLGLFGPGNRFPGSNLQGPTSPAGLEYGITSAGDNLATGNVTVTGMYALIQNSVDFRLSGLPSDFDPSIMISNVVFQYGTSLSDPSIPEPSSLILLGLGGILAIRRR